MAGVDLKNQGNDHFKAGEYLKAAACYTKAIKADPANHVYYSNRSQAFLKLNKVTKAVEDADKCLELAPDFIKGYHRKACALHALEKNEDALKVVLEALIKDEGNGDLKRLGLQIKGKEFAGILRAERVARGLDEPPPAKPLPKAAKKEEPKKKEASPAAVDLNAPADGADSAPQHLWALDPPAFAIEMIKDALQHIIKDGSLPSSVYLQPARPTKSSEAEPALGCVSIDQAFTNPENLMNCVEFLRKHIDDTKAQAVAVVAMKKSVGYPQVWKDKSKQQWPFSKKGDGIFLQLEAPGVRSMWFTALDKVDGQLKVGETVELAAADFALVPPLYR